MVQQARDSKKTSSPLTACCGRLMSSQAKRSEGLLCHVGCTTMQLDVFVVNTEDTLQKQTNLIVSASSNHVDCLRIRAEDDSIFRALKELFELDDSPAQYSIGPSMSVR